MKRKERILILSTVDYGGAGIGAQLAVDDLRQQGYNVDFLVYAQKQTNEQTLAFINIRNRFISFVFRAIWFLYRIFIKNIYCMGVNEGNTFSVNHTFVSNHKILRKISGIPDLILIGWTDNFVSTKTVKSLYSLTRAKIAYMMVDNYPITGGCHYPFTCVGFQKDCSDCPIIGRKDLACRILRQKQDDLKGIELYLIGTTHDCNRAKLSTLFKDAHVYSYVQTNELSHLGSRQSGRNRFEIGDDDFVLLFGAQDVKNKRKGFDCLMQALQLFTDRIEDRNVTLLVAGNCNENLIFNTSKVCVKYIGHVSLPDLYCAYAASDIFVCSSVEDSGPMMINYSIGLGIPVVAFKMGVALDLVIPGKTGFLVDLYNIRTLAECILKMYKLNSLDYSDFKQNCLLLYKKMQKENSLVNAVDQILSNNTDV